MQMKIPEQIKQTEGKTITSQARKLESENVKTKYE